MYRLGNIGRQLTVVLVIVIKMAIIDGARGIDSALF